MSAPARPRLLFVDDEPQLLEGLQNLLRSCRKEWDMVFAPGGERGLAELRARPFDVIVADVRMPGMDGRELLARTQAEFPDVARLVLSGHAERDVVCRLAPLAHQFLTKPCEPLALRRVLQRVIRLRERLGPTELRALAGRVRSLPCSAQVVSDLGKALEGADSLGPELRARLSAEPALVARVLQVTSSAFFGRSLETADVDRACQYLVPEIVRKLALELDVTPGDGPEEPALGTFLAHARETAAVATALAPPALAREAAVAGLLHDVGALLIARHLPEKSAEVARRTRSEGGPVHEIERALLGASHADLGAYLLGLWALPDRIVDAVAHHDSPASAPPEAGPLVALVHVAEAITSGLPDERIEPGALARVGASAVRAGRAVLGGRVGTPSREAARPVGCG